MFNIILSFFVNSCTIYNFSSKINFNEIFSQFKEDEKFIYAEQILVVISSSTNTSFATLYTFEKLNDKISGVFSPFKVVAGKNGFALPQEKQEGDGKTPLGIYRLETVFSPLEKLKTGLKHIKTQEDDFWVDDVNSPQYNQWVRGKPQANSYEKMNIPLYKYCIVIQYNTEPIVIGKGSAIFIHLWRNSNTPTAGCVAMEEKNLRKLLAWLDKNKNPVIIITTTDMIFKK